MKRVTYLIDGLSPGGAERQLLQLMYELDKRSGVAQRLVVLGKKGFYSESNLNRVDCIYLETLPQVIKWIARFIWMIHTDKTEGQVVSTWLYRADGLGCLIKALNPRVRLVWNIRNSEIILSGRTKKAMMRLLVFSSRIFPDSIVYNSFTGREDHEKFGYPRDKGAIVRNGISPTLLARSTYHELPPEKRIGANRDFLSIGIIGRDHPQKGFSVLREAWNLLDTSMKEKIRFVVAGPVSSSSTIKSLASVAQVEPLGNLFDVDKFYSEIDVLCVPSVFGEGTPNVVLEAISMKVFIIGTNCGDMNRIIKSNFGVVGPTNSPDFIAQAILDSATDWIGGRFFSPDPFEYNKFLNEFSMEASARRYIDALKV